VGLGSGFRVSRVRWSGGLGFWGFGGVVEGLVGLGVGLGLGFGVGAWAWATQHFGFGFGFGLAFGFGLGLGFGFGLGPQNTRNVLYYIFDTGH